MRIGTPNEKTITGLVVQANEKKRRRRGVYREIRRHVGQGDWYSQLRRQLGQEEWYSEIRRQG